jgi:glutaredoxin
MKITIIGKRGCMKCSKMKLILDNRGHETELIYVDSIGKLTVNDTTIDITEDTHFPIYAVDKNVFFELKDLTESIG